MPIQRDKPSHLGEKTEDMPTLRDKPSHLGVIRRRLLCRLDPPFFGIVQIDTISPWCTRKCQSPRAHHRAGGQAGCGHSSPGN
ncbi:hypothetical protein TNCV_798291 [Trichonephila clavipes]|nr:hypothetical protein TNCV_798291 [Trichonephila clavipes]